MFVFSPASTNVTVMFPTGAGVEVRLIEGTMTTTVLLPEAFKDSTLGLLGKMNGDAADDLVLSNGQLVRDHNNSEEVFSFGASCKKPMKSMKPLIVGQNSCDVCIRCESVFISVAYLTLFIL